METLVEREGPVWVIITTNGNAIGDLVRSGGEVIVFKSGKEANDWAWENVSGGFDVVQLKSVKY